MPDSAETYRRVFESAGDGLIISDATSGHVIEANAAAAEMHGFSRADFLNLRPGLVPQDDRPRPAGTDGGIAPHAGGRAGLELHLRRDGSTFYAEVRETPVTFGGQSCVLSVIRDVSKRVETEQALRQQVEIASREQATLLEVSQTLASALELKPGLILDQLRVILEYSSAGLFVLEQEDLIALAMRGPLTPEQSVPLRIRMDDPDILTRLFNTNQPVRIADISGADPPAQFLRGLLESQAAVLLTGVKAWMWVPVAVKGRVIGSVGVGHPATDYFTAHHADLALTVANQAAITMVNAELYEHAQALAALRERQRLAQELHDAVNQSLFSAGLIAEVLPRLWERNVEEGRRSLEDLRRLTRGALAEMRMLLVELRPSALTDSELGDLLRLLGNAFTGRANIPVAVSIAGQGALPTEVQVAFYRLCQEALNNIAKHAVAEHVEIQLRFGANSESVELGIHDDGRGFDPSRAFPGHYGLSMMRERAEAVSAALSVSSEQGQGTRVTVSWSKRPVPSNP